MAFVGCGGSASKERREFEKLEASLGMISSARPEDRSIRLEQLQNLRVETERVMALKKLCTSSYASFVKATHLLEQAGARTRGVESEIAKADNKKRSGVALTPEEEKRLLEMSVRAAKALETVTTELDLAQKLVDSCEKKRAAMKAQLASE